MIDEVLPLHKGIYNKIVSKFNDNKGLSFKLTTYSDALPGSGLGSSSTMVVAILHAFVEWLKLPLGEYDLAHLAYEIERKDLALKGGKQDQYSAAFGGVNFMEFYNNDRVIVNPLRVKQWIKNELEDSLVLYYTGQSRESSRIIEEQIKGAVGKDAKSLAAMHETKATAIKMKEALLTGDFEEFVNCMNRGWEQKKKASSVISNEHLDEAGAALTRLYTALRGVEITGEESDEDYKSRFEQAMADDFNTPMAISVLFDMSHELNRLKNSDVQQAVILAAQLKKLAQLLGLLETLQFRLQNNRVTK